MVAHAPSATLAGLHGLEGVGFVDKTADGARLRGDAGPSAIAAETDRVYLGTEARVTIEDSATTATIEVQRTRG